MSSRKNVLKKILATLVADEENVGIFNSNLYLEMPLNCFFIEISIYAKHAYTYAKTFHLKESFFSASHLTENKHLSVTLLLLPYHPQPVTLLKIKQEFGERGFLL